MRCAKLLQSCLTLCYPMDCSLPGSSVHWILQARILQWVAMPSFRDLPYPGMEPMFPVSPTLAGRFFTTNTTWEAQMRLILEDHCFNTPSLICPVDFPASL